MCPSHIIDDFLFKEPRSTTPVFRILSYYKYNKMIEMNIELDTHTFGGIQSRYDYQDFGYDVWYKRKLGFSPKDVNTGNGTIQY